MWSDIVITILKPTDHIRNYIYLLIKMTIYITMNILAKPCYLNWDRVMETFYVQEFPPWFFCYYEHYILWSNISIPLWTIIKFFNENDYFSKSLLFQLRLLCLAYWERTSTTCTYKFVFTRTFNVIDCFEND